MRHALAILFAGWLAAAAYASRDRPSNGIFKTVSGDVSITTRATDQLEGNGHEYARYDAIPSRLSVPQLDLTFDFMGPATLDVKLRSFAEDDRAVHVKLKDLRAFIVLFDYSESFYYHRQDDEPDAPRLNRRQYKLDFYLRRFNDHPVHLFADGIARRGGLDIDHSSFDFDRIGANADLDILFARLTFEIPHFHFADKLRKENEIDDTTVRAGLHRQSGNFFFSTEFQSRHGDLTFFRQSYEQDDLDFNSQFLNLFGFHDLSARVQLHYRWRPHIVTLNFHDQDNLVGDFTLSLTPIEHASVQAGIARKTVDTRRLQRAGMDKLDAALDAGKIPSQRDLAADLLQLETTGYETYAKLYFNNWNKFSGHAKFSQLVMQNVPGTDVTDAYSRQLLPDEGLTHEYRFAYNPIPEFGFSITRTEQERRNDVRSILRDVVDELGVLKSREAQGTGIRTLSRYTDFYVYLVSFQHLTTAAGISDWGHTVSQSIFDDLLESLKSYTFDIKWDFSNGLELFANLRQNENKGARVATEHIAESGVRFGDRGNFDGRVSVTFDKLVDHTFEANNYRQISLNMAASSHF